MDVKVMQSLPFHEKLETKHLQRLFDNMSECYKLFWFQAIIEEVYSGSTIISFDTLINSMVANGWYMVNEYKLNLGPSDTLEALILDIQTKTDVKSSEKKEIIIKAIKELNDNEIKKKKLTLTYNVPYRLQAPFLDFKGSHWNIGKVELSARINSYSGIIYRFGEICGLDSTIIIDETWRNYIISNFEILYGWIQFNMIQYLQRRNPNVPGIPNKLFPPQERKLQKVKHFWSLIFELTPIFDLYSQQPICKGEISIDHFIPWSYVAHDELWNLCPTTKSINSKKSNHLPSWNLYFPLLQHQEYEIYKLIWQYPKVHAEFEKCARDHINSNEARNKLYRQGLSKENFYKNLEEIISPIYAAAENLGFTTWRLE